MITKIQRSLIWHQLICIQKSTNILIQDELITRGRKHTSSVKVSSNKEVDQELSVALNLLCEYLQFKNYPSSGISHYRQSPGCLQITKKLKRKTLK